jgi:ankyrin repeat protein
VNLAEGGSVVTVETRAIKSWLFLVSVVFLLAGCYGPKTPLGGAANRDDLGAVEQILAQGADPCEKVGGYSAFDWAQGEIRGILNRDAMKVQVYRAMLDKAYQRFSEGRECKGILFYAARMGDAEMIKGLLARGEDPNQGQEDWETSPLGIAAYYGHGDAVRALVAGGAQVERQIDNLEKTRAWAVSFGVQTSYERTTNAIKILRASRENAAVLPSTSP